MHLPVRSFAALLLLVAATGCRPPPPMAELELVTTRPDTVSASSEVLERGVEAEWCFSENLIAVTLRPPSRARLADHGRAVALAIDSVPGADVLLDVALHVRVEQYLLFQRICAIAKGDAARIVP